MPKPEAPALRQSAMLSGLTPPTGNSGTLEGSTARRALTTAGPIISAGNSLSACAPALRAANASLGVATPGMHARPRRRACCTTSASKCGEMISRPPAACTLRTSAALITVPAPISKSGCCEVSAAMLSSGRGELSGTSRSTKPAPVRACPMAGASAGVRPRRMATSGSCCRPEARSWAVVVFMVSKLSGQCASQCQVAGPGGFIAEALGVQAQRLQCALVTRGECGAAHQQQGAMVVRLHGTQFFADQQTRQKAGMPVCGQGVEKGQRAGGEDAGEDDGCALGQQHGIAKSGFVPRRVGHHGAREDGVLAQQGIDLAGHETAKTGDAALR